MISTCTTPSVPERDLLGLLQLCLLQSRQTWDARSRVPTQMQPAPWPEIPSVLFQLHQPLSTSTLSSSLCDLVDWDNPELVGFPARAHAIIYPQANFTASVFVFSLLLPHQPGTLLSEAHWWPGLRPDCIPTSLSLLLGEALQQMPANKILHTLVVFYLAAILFVLFVARPTNCALLKCNLQTIFDVKSSDRISHTTQQEHLRYIPLPIGQLLPWSWWHCNHPTVLQNYNEKPLWWGKGVIMEIRLSAGQSEKALKPKSTHFLHICSAPWQLTANMPM